MARQGISEMKYYTYVLRSRNYDKYYIGHTKSLIERLDQHNSGKTRSIRPYIPYELIYFEAYNSRDEAMAREKYLKSGIGREFLKTTLSQAPVVQLDRISDFGSEG